MLKLAVAYLSTAAAFLVADGLWLGTMANAVYRPRLGDLLAAEISWPPAIAFYLLYVVGLVCFGVMPALDGGRWTTAFASGAAFGFFCYATYDLTNQATLRGWPVTITVVDIAWGTFASGLSAALGFLATTAVSRVAG